jgi:hypothetical protein
MSLNVATRFASCIDESRYDEAAALLAEQCTYTYTEGTYQGREHVISVYRMNTDFMRKTFDEVKYSSSVEAQPDGSYKINFTDRIKHGFAEHEAHSYEIMRIENDHITSIEHFELPGEAEAMRAFYIRQRSASGPLDRRSGLL